MRSVDLASTTTPGEAVLANDTEQLVHGALSGAHSIRCLRRAESAFTRLLCCLVVGAATPATIHVGKLISGCSFASFLTSSTASARFVEHRQTSSLSVIGARVPRHGASGPALWIQQKPATPRAPPGPHVFSSSHPSARPSRLSCAARLYNHPPPLDLFPFTQELLVHSLFARLQTRHALVFYFCADSSCFASTGLSSWLR